MPQTKRLRQFKFFFKSGEMVPITLEPEDTIDIKVKEFMIRGRRGPKNERFNHTVCRDALAHYRLIEWDEPLVEEVKGPNPQEEETEPYPLRG